MEKLIQIKGVLALIDARESYKRRVNFILDIMASHENTTLFKANGTNMKEWLTKIGKLNRKIVDSCCRVLDSKESVQEQDKIKESVYSPLKYIYCML